MERERTEMRQSILDSPLQQQAHTHPARRRFSQCPTKFRTREKIRAGDQHLGAGLADRSQIGAFNRAAVAKIVALGKRRAYLPGWGGEGWPSLARREHRRGALWQRGPTNRMRASPDLGHGAHRLLNQRPANPKRKVQPRRLEPAPHWILVVIDQIDAAHEQLGRINQRKLTVQTSKRLPLQTPAT